ncbi:hypothetical protein [Nonomuraea sp. NPDC048916]|uniref:hypothetical protein n=1 Tax=Nonomuraea sp. NPDC048916 TaxID=3154232 RepID=UPI0033F5A160
MRKVLAAAALAGSITTGLALAAPAQAATATVTATLAAPAAAQSAPVNKWGKYYSSNHQAYSYGHTWKSNGKVYTKWYGKESTSEFGYVWFKYYSNGSWHKFYKKWDGSHSETWSRGGIKKVYTYTCWSSPTKYCGSSHRIY